MKKEISKQFVLIFVIFIVFMNLRAASYLDYDYQEGPVYRIKWISKADLPLPHRNGKAVACRGKIYFMGGYSPETEDVRETSNYVYDPQKDEWAVKADVPTGRSNFAVASFEERIFVIGGDPLLSNNDLYLPAENKWEVLAPITIPRQHIDCGRIGNKIYVVGGLIKNPEPSEESQQKIPAIATDTVEIYDIEENMWELGKPLQEARQGVQVAVVDGNLYAIGGAYDHRKGFMLSSSFERCDPESGTWESLPDLPVPVLAPGVAVIEGKIFIIGGSTIKGESQEASDKVYVFDTNRNRWGTASPLPKEIQFPGVAFIGDRIYVIGGCDKEFNALDSVYEGIILE
jgi:N-acetylneuraminic acid mutarotase